MKSSVGKGALILIISGLICKFFGALFRLPLTNILGIEGIGIFQMIMSVYALLSAIVTSGVSSALSKLISTARASGEMEKARKLYALAMKFALILALVLGFIILFLSGSISSLQGNSQNKIIYMLFVLLLPLSALIGVIRGVMQGYEDMTPTAISQIIEQVAKFAFGLIFAYIFISGGATKGVFGAFLGITFSELLALIYLFFSAQKRISPFKAKSTKSVQPIFFKAVLPLTLSYSISPFASMIESLFFVTLLGRAGFESEIATKLYGLQSGVVGAILNFPLIISMSIAVALLPKISFLNSRNDHDGQRTVIANSFSAMWFLLVPLVFGIISIAKDLYAIIYPSLMQDNLVLAWQLTIISGIGVLLSAIMQFLVSILQAKGYFNYSLAFNLTTPCFPVENCKLIGGIFRIALVFILAPIPSINIFALPIASIVNASIVCICALIKLGKVVKISFTEFFLPLISSVVMLLSLLLLQSAVSGIGGLVLSVIVGAFIYFICALPLCLQYLRMLISKIKRTATEK